MDDRLLKCRRSRSWRRICKAMGRYLTAVRDANMLANYSGPVLVEGDAAPLLVRWVFIPSLAAVRPTIGDRMMGQPSQGQTESPFRDKIGARVVPEFLSLVDDPTVQEFDDPPMAPA